MRTHTKRYDLRLLPDEWDELRLIAERLKMSRAALVRAGIAKMRIVMLERMPMQRSERPRRAVGR
jgi:hypothetical protein